MPVLQVAPKTFQTCFPSVSYYSRVHQQNCFTACNSSVNYILLQRRLGSDNNHIVDCRHLEKKMARNWWQRKMLNWQLKDGACIMYLKPTTVPQVSLTCPVPERSSPHWEESCLILHKLPNKIVNNCNNKNVTQQLVWDYHCLRVDH